MDVSVIVTAGQQTQKRWWVEDVMIVETLVPLWLSWRFETSVRSSSTIVTLALMRR